MDIMENQEELAGYFADCLIDQKYPAGLDDAGYETVKQELIERINKEIGQIIFDNLANDQLEEMENLLDEADDRRTSAFLRDNLPDLRRLILQRLVALKEEINSN